MVGAPRCGGFWDRRPHLAHRGSRARGPPLNDGRARLSARSVRAGSGSGGFRLRPAPSGPRLHRRSPAPPLRTGIDQLRLLAEATGGVFTWYDSAQGLSSIAERILSRRTVYQLTYLSRLDSSGSHEVRVAVTRQGAEVLSTARSFEVRVQPPEVAFVAPPEVIRRQGDDPTQPLEELPPTGQELRLLIA